MLEHPQVRNLLIGDIKSILQLTRDEGWICDVKELFHILRANPHGSFALVRGDCLIGCLTTVIYQRTAWIGNFIVAPDCRKSGWGSLLFQQAVDYLNGEKMSTIYLTASPKAIKIYKKFDFQEITLINRWEKVLWPVETDGKELTAKSSTLARIISFDQQCWQDDRSTLIGSIWSRRNCFEHRTPYGFIMFSRVNKYKMIGPWEVAGNDIIIAEKLLKGVYSLIRKKEMIVLDVPAVNLNASTLLAYHGFNIKDTTTLMYYGSKPHVNMEGIFALGSLGSIG